MNLYQRYLSSPIESRKVSREDQIKIAEAIVWSDDYNLCERANSVVIAIYKSLELDFYGKASEFRKIAEDLAKKASIEAESNSEFLGIRNDPGQLYISLLAALRHIEILEYDYSFGSSKAMIDFMENDQLLAPSYSLNLGQGMLQLAYYHFSVGDHEGYLRLANLVYNYFSRSLNKSAVERLPSSSHFGDLMKMGNHIQILLAGVEWIKGTRKREKLFNEERIAKLTSRVAEEGFLSIYKDYLKKI